MSRSVPAGASGINVIYIVGGSSEAVLFKRREVRSSLRAVSDESIRKPVHVTGRTMS